MANFTFFDEQFRAGYRDTLQKNVEAFVNQAGPEINIAVDDAQGEQTREAFFQRIGDTVNNLDPSGSGAATIQQLGEGELTKPHVNRRVGPFEVRDIDLERRQLNSQEYSGYIGQQVAEDTQEDYVDTLVNAATGALGSVTDLSVSKASTLTYEALIDALAAFGDRGGNIGTLVMHSKPFYDLMGEQLNVNGTDVPGAFIFEGRVGTANRQAVVVDSDALVNTGSPTTYNTLLLRDGALQLEELFAPSMKTETDVTDTAGPATRMAGIQGYKVDIRGFDFTGPQHPSNAELDTTGNWNHAMSSIKNSPGVLLETE